MLKRETDGPVLYLYIYIYFFPFRISYAAQGPGSSGISNYISVHYVYIGCDAKMAYTNYSNSMRPQPLLVLNVPCAVHFN